VTQVLLAAFCAWDGGRLPTQEELGGTTGAWGSAKYPWGTTEFYETTVPNAPGRAQYTWTPGTGGNFNQAAFYVSAITQGAVASRNPDAADYNITNWNPFQSSPTLPQVRYAWPVVPYAAWGQTDQAFAVAAPGRMYRDFRQVGGAGEGYYDVGANLIEITGAPTACSSDANCAPPLSTCNMGLGICQDDANHDSLPAVPWVGGSFEGHNPGVRNGYHRNILTKYGKMGGRCVRPL
jgi:hypothetical protein